VPIVKVRTNRQVTIPKVIFDELGLQEGEFVEVKRVKDRIVIKPKKLVDPDDILTPEEEELVHRGEEELKRGEGIPWEQVKKELKL
jgi:AbrB family looped-hinge helix DNA binding protein